MKHIKIYNDLEEIEKVYLELEEKVSNSLITVSYFWIKKWWEIFQNDSKTGKYKKIIFATVWESERILYIAPLMLSTIKIKGLNIRTLQFITQSWGATYCDVISDNMSAEVFEDALKVIRRKYRYDILLLDHIPSFTKNFNIHDLFPYAACPEVNLKNFISYSEYKQKRYSKGLKQNIRTAYNRAKRNNDNLTKEHLNHNESIFNRIIEIAKTKLRDDKDNKYSDSLKARFRDEVMSCFTSNITSIKLNNDIVAYRTNLICGGVKYCFDASYDRDYPRYNLGIISVDASIEDSYNKSLKYHCEGPGLDFYKLRFSTHDVILNYYIKKGNTLKSFIIYPILRKFIVRKSKKFISTYEASK